MKMLCSVLAKVEEEREENPYRPNPEQYSHKMKKTPGCPALRAGLVAFTANQLSPQVNTTASQLTIHHAYIQADTQSLKYNRTCRSGVTSYSVYRGKYKK